MLHQISEVKKPLENILLNMTLANDDYYYEEDYGDNNYSVVLYQSLNVKKQLLNAQLNTNINWFIYKNHDKEVKVVKIDTIDLTYPLR